MVRPTLALLALLIPQGLLASEVHVSSSPSRAAVTEVAGGTELRTSVMPLQGVATARFEKAERATPIRFDIDAMCPIRLEILSEDGTVVSTLASGLWAAGEHELAWYGVDDEGASVEDGPYVVRLTLLAQEPAVAFALPAIGTSP